MGSKLERIAVYLHALAKVTDEQAAHVASVATRVASAAARAAALRAEHRGPPYAMVAAYQRARPALANRAVPLLGRASARLRQAAAELCAVSPSFCGGGAGAVVAAGLPVIERVGEPVGGHGGPDAEPAHHPIEDISRERIRELLRTADGPADLPEALVLLRADWIDAGGHTFLRHHIDHAGEDAQASRCMHKLDPATGSTTDWTTSGRHRCGREATAFKSAAAIIYAEARAWDSPTGVEKRTRADSLGGFKVEFDVPARQILGPSFRDHLIGWTRIGSDRYPTGAASMVFSEDIQVRLVYQRQTLIGPWRLETMYPRRPESPHPKGARSDERS